MMPISFIIPFACSLQDYSKESPAVEKVRLRARVAYDGTEYSGWQFQKQSPTIQAELENAISRRVGTLVRVVGASRTDAGVHARGQGVHFDIPVDRLERCGETQKFEFTVNQMLPHDIRLSNFEKAPFVPLPEYASTDEISASPREEGHYVPSRPWHAIYCSKGKLYTYRFSTGPVHDPLQRLYRHHEWRAIRGTFSEEALREAALKFEGTHDFTAFTNAALPPPGMKSPVIANPFRRIHSAHVISEGEGQYRIEFRINGAMYRMIRNIMGTLLDVACGKLQPSGIDTLFESKDRRLVPKSAPAKGLCLEEVFYDDWKL